MQPSIETKMNRRGLMMGLGVVAAAALSAVALIASTGKAATPSAPKAAVLAPNFTADAADGTRKSLADYAGKTVVLEWTNAGCPYVKKHYNTGNMQNLQAEATKAGVVWLSVISSAPGKQGFATASEASAIAAKAGATPTTVLLDPTGVVGKAYGAKTTPHMFVINPKGEIVYRGAIDDQATAMPTDVSKARNYVREALMAVAEGKTPEVTSTKPYGCGIKY